MCDLQDWSAVKAQNSVPDVNDKFQEIMAAVRCYAENLGFFNPGCTPTRIDDTRFSVAGDKRELFLLCQRVRLLDGGVKKYGTIIEVVLENAVTKIKVDMDEDLTISGQLSAVAVGPDPRAIPCKCIARSSFEDVTGDTTGRGIGLAISSPSFVQYPAAGAFNNDNNFTNGLFRTDDTAVTTDYIGWDYGADERVRPNRITIRQYRNETNNSKNASEVAVEVSDDLVSWTEIARFNPAPAPDDDFGPLTTHDVANAPLTRAVRLRPTQFTGASFWYVAEVEIIENPA